MLARIRTSKDQKDQGFTLIELLVVMIIIGILAAIAIPVFLSQRAKAQDSATKADASTVGKEIATWFVDNTAAPTVQTNAAGRYLVNAVDVGKVSNGVGFYASGGAATPVLVANGTNVTTTNWSASQWCVTLANPNGSTKAWKYSAQNGLESGICSATNAP